jgi:hypothetical protein
MVSVFLLVKSMRGPHGLCNSGATDLGAEGREGRLVLWVDGTTTGTAALLGAGTAGSAATTLATAATATATALTTATSTTALATATTGTTTATVTSVGGGVVLTVKSKGVLGLGLLGAVLLGTGTGEVLLVSALHGLALGELLAGALVGLADGEAVAGKSLALLGKVGKVLLVGLGVVLLRLGGGVHTVGTGSGGRVGSVVVLNFGSSKVGTSLLVVPLRGTLLEAPAVTGLLLVLAFVKSARWSSILLCMLELTQCQCGCDGRRGRAYRHGRHHHGHHGHGRGRSGCQWHHHGALYDVSWIYEQ